MAESPKKLHKHEQNLTSKPFYFLFLPLSKYRTHLPNELALKMDGAKASYLYSTIRSSAVIWWVGGREGCCAACGVSQSETAFSADLGGSSKYSNENFEDCVEKGSAWTAIGRGLVGPKR